MDWRTMLEHLEAQLAGLQAAGIGYLNVALDPELAALPLPGKAPTPTEAPATPSPRGATARAASGPQYVVGATPRARGQAPPPSRPATKAPGPEGHPSEFHSLEALEQAFCDCRRCGLAAGRSRVVFGVGHERPRLLFIGEGPGQEEDRQGLPFVGRAGQLLTRGILALGLTREDVYIANVVKCRPPGNRNPAPDEVAACAPILQRQIELLDPAVIVTLGNVPLKALNPVAPGITQARGSVFLHRQWKVLPTYHPAYLLRNPNGLEAWWADLQQAFALAYSGKAP